MYITYHYLGEYPDNELKYVVIVSRFQGKWILCKHKSRESWEIPGGHIEPCESADAAARRELYEETGAMDFSLRPVNIYAVQNGGERTLGMLYFAEIKTRGALPIGSEMEDVGYFDDLPEKLTYPEIQPFLFAYVNAFLSPKAKKEDNELWDIYDEDRLPTGRVHRRGDLIPEGDYHLVVHACVQNADGRILLTRRCAEKGFPYKWEWTGGSALMGEDSLSAAIREIKEETGLCVHAENGRLLKSMRRVNDFVDVWLFREHFELSSVCLQEGETCDKRLVPLKEFLDMANGEELVPYPYLDEFIQFIKNNNICGGIYGNSDS